MMTRIAQLEDDLRVLKMQLQQLQAQFDLVDLQRKTEKERLHASLNNMLDGTLYHSVRDAHTGTLRFEYVSSAWEKILGVSAEESMSDSQNVFAYFEPDDLKRLKQCIYDPPEPTAFNIEMRYNHPVTKKQRWLQMISHPREEGDLIVADGIITDITRHKEAERELETEKIRLQHLGVNIPAGSLYQFVCDTRTRQMRMSYVSDSWENVTGISAEESLNNIFHVFSNVHRDDYEVLIKSIDESEHNMSDFKQEIRIHNRWMQLYSRPRREEEMIVWDGLVMNITAQKEAEAELTRYRQNLEKLVKERTDELTAANEELYATNEELTAVNEELNKYQIELEITNEELTKYQTELEKMVNVRTKELVLAKDKAEESDRLKSSFLANMSHEIRTPLNGIVGFLQFLESDNLLPARRHEYIDVIKNSSTQLTKIIEDIIDVSKIEAKLLSMNPFPVHLNELMNEMRLFFVTYLRSKNKGHIELILDDSGFLDNCFICVDTVRLRQVIINLMGNAVKFTDKGYIRFGYQQSAPDMLEFIVEDSGIGLPEEQKDIIFERFFQIELGNQRLNGGTGLGLSISRSLVQMMGGEMWVKSTESFGSTFCFTIAYLPVVPEDEHIFTENSTKQTKQNKPFANKMVLLAESVHMKSIFYENLILSAGVAVIKVGSVEEWYKRLAQTNHFDLVIADATLFDNKESEQINQFIHAHSKLPIVLIVSKEKQKVYQNLCSTTIELPVGYAKILKVLEEYLK